MMVRSSFVYERRKSVARTATGLVGPTYYPSDSGGVVADASDESYKEPDVNGEYKLKPCLCVCIHSFCEACFYAKVQVQPGNEYCQNVGFLGWEEYSSIDSKDIGIEGESTYRSS